MNQDNIPSFGANESPFDPRTIKSDELTLGGLPPASLIIDYTGLKHKDQMKVGICTASCVVTLAEKYFASKGIQFKGSMEWLYKIGKKMVEGTTYEGSSIFVMLKAAQKYGIPSEDLFPSNCNRNYTDFMSDLNITQEMLDDAAKHKIPGYVSVAVNPESIITALNSTPAGLATRMVVGTNWYTNKQGQISWKKEDLDPLRKLENPISGHAIAQIGYDSNGLLTLFDRNTWGDDWADKGNISFKFDEHPEFTEAWMIIDKVLFTKDLYVGITSPDVKRLQQYLNIKGYLVATEGAGSLGNETEFFGSRTMTALKRWQKENKIPSTGYFGPISRAFINNQ